MAKNKLTIICLIVLACLLILIGWLRYHRQKAVAEAAMSKTDLKNTKSELFKVKQARDKLEGRLTQLTKERDDQIAKTGDLQAIIDHLENELKEKAEEVVNSKLYRIVFTDGWNEDTKLPKNNLKEIPISTKCLYVFCKWRLSLKDHTYTIKIFDGSKEILYERKYDLKPTTPTWNTWPGYYINKYIDKPGQWTVEVYLDGRKVGEKSIDVLPEVETVLSDSNEVAN